MPRPKSSTPPAYRLHKPSGKAVVTIDGEDHYLGAHGTDESRARYDALLTEWLANGRRLPPQSDAAGTGINVKQLVSYYLTYAEEYYRFEGRGSSEYRNLCDSARPMVRLFGDVPVELFGPSKLRAVQHAMIELKLARKTINQRVNRIRRIFKWGVSREMVPGSILHGLQAVEPLKYGRSQARETEPVRPVPDAAVDAIKGYVSDQVWAMIELQRLTAMRPGEVVIMRRCDLDISGDLWEYRPAQHKTKHHGKARIIPIGPKARAIIEQFLKPELDAYLFSPADADRKRREQLHAKRKTPLSCGNRPGSNRRRAPKRKPRDRYMVATYYRAITYACDRAFPPPAPLARREKETLAEWRARLTPDQKDQLRKWQQSHRWHPHQLRHNRATELRKKFGIEAARVALGHSSADVTEIYAQADQALASDIARRIG